jgi:hypothetical protein
MPYIIHNYINNQCHVHYDVLYNNAPYAILNVRYTRFKMYINFYVMITMMFITQCTHRHS